MQNILPKYPKIAFIFRNPAVFKEIQSLNPEKDHCRIIHLLGSYQFPWDLQRALEIALFRTFSSPSVSALLDKTGEFKRAGQKRYDDTGVLIGEFMQNGYDSESGMRAITQMNAIHAHYPIPNEDYLYVLSTFIFDPIEWIEKFGWRKLTANEKSALFYFFREVGIRMNLKDIPETADDFKNFANEYEKKHLMFSETNRNVANATVKIVQKWYPGFLSPLIRTATAALIDDKMRMAFGYAKPNRFVVGYFYFLLYIRKLFIRFVDFEKSPKLLENSLNRTYPKHDYKIEEIMPTNLKKNRKVDLD